MDVHGDTARVLDLLWVVFLLPRDRAPRARSQTVLGEELGVAGPLSLDQPGEKKGAWKCAAESSPLQRGRSTWPLGGPRVGLPWGQACFVCRSAAGLLVYPHVFGRPCGL